MGANVLVAFFMMPFVLHRLGDIGYGFWVFLQSTVSFMFLLDFGVRSSLTRYLAKYFAENDDIEANRVFNIGLLSYSLICLLIVGASFVFGLVFQDVLPVNGIDAWVVFWTVLLVGASVGLNFPAAVFNAILTGHQRYDLMNLAQIISLGIRTGLIVIGLSLGYGLVAISLSTFLGSGLVLFLNFLFARKIYPPLIIRFTSWEWTTVKRLANHGLFSFIALGAMRLLTDAGIVLVGVFIGPAAVTIYSIGVSLTTYANQLVSGITTTLTPAASALEAKKDWENLVDLCLSSAKFILLIGFTILLTYIISGDTFISLWLGKEYALSYTPLVLLSLSWGFYYLQNAIFVILIGLSKHKIPALLMLGQAVLNVSMGFYFVQQVGMIGVAWGALIASGVMNGLSLRYGLSKLGISGRQYFVKTLVPAFLGLLPFAISLITISFLFEPNNLLTYFIQVFVSLFMACMCLPWLTLNPMEWERVLKVLYGLMERCAPLAPLKLRTSVKEFFHGYYFSLAVRRVMTERPNGYPLFEDLVELRRRWGNEGFAISVEILEEVVKRAEKTKGPILECGSGLTTILLGMIARKRGIEVWSLEHNPTWAHYVEKILQQCKIQGVEICQAPLYDYGEFTWYQPPWERMPSGFQLIVCDGPPGSIPGGRYGLVPLSKEKFDKNAIIILDDAQRPMEAEIARRWAEEGGMNLEFRSYLERSLAILTSH